MKTSLIEIGKTYCNETGNSARKVLEIHTSIDATLKHNGLTVVIEDRSGLIRARVDLSRINVGDTAVIYEQMRGPAIGTVSALSLSSFASWANQEDRSVLAGNKLDRAVQAIEYLLPRAHRHLCDETTLAEIQALVKEIKK